MASAKRRRRRRRRLAYQYQLAQRSAKLYKETIENGLA